MAISVKLSGNTSNSHYSLSNGALICNENTSTTETYSESFIVYLNDSKYPSCSISSGEINISQNTEPTCSYTIDLLNPTSSTITLGLFEERNIQLRFYENGVRFNSIDYDVSFDTTDIQEVSKEQGVAPGSVTGAPSVNEVIRIIKPYSTGITQYVTYKYDCSNEIKLGIKYKETVIPKKLSILATGDHSGWNIKVRIWFGGLGEEGTALYQMFREKNSLGETDIIYYYKDKEESWIKVDAIPFVNEVGYTIEAYGFDNAVEVYYDTIKLKTTNNNLTDMDGIFFINNI